MEAPIALEAVLAIEDNVRAQIQFKEKVNPSILKGNFSSRAEPSIFTSIAPVLLDLLKVAVEFFQQ